MTEEDRRSSIGLSNITERLEGQIRIVDDSIPHLVEDIVHFNNSARPLIIREVSESSAKKNAEFVVGKGKGIPYHKSDLTIQTEIKKLDVEKVELNSISNSADLVAEEIISMEISEVIEKKNMFSLLQHVNEEGNVVSTKAISLIANEENQQELEIITDDKGIKSTVIHELFNIMNTTNQSVVCNEDTDDKFDKYGESYEDGKEVSSTSVSVRIPTNIKFKLQKELKSLGRYGHQLDRSVQISEDRPEHRPECKMGRFKIGLIVQADLKIIPGDQFKSEENHPEHRPEFELANIYRPEVTKADLTIIQANQFKSKENRPEHHPEFELADIYRPEVSKVHKIRLQIGTSSRLGKLGLSQLVPFSFLESIIIAVAPDAKSTRSYCNLESAQDWKTSDLHDGDECSPDTSLWCPNELRNPSTGDALVPASQASDSSRSKAGLTDSMVVGDIDIGAKMDNLIVKSNSVDLITCTIEVNIHDDVASLKAKLESRGLCSKSGAVELISIRHCEDGELDLGNLKEDSIVMPKEPSGNGLHNIWEK
ncbi:hypothetical protein MA16_Dca023361 [Dendrobium catenatum]|uniref:Uncharacterized protein n=1 Tax=Dendrobium catenatum TaxID=906689 RepID=A0A2I0WJK6_9ASPA|nr:hypothetical protein MA16_Dca023361 [Dendrobium catenatum]